MSEQSKFFGITTKLGLSPLELLQTVGSKNSSLFIGMPKEKTFQEHRVSLTPYDVKILVENGHRIIIETGAGKESYYKDHDFSEAGAEISYSTEEVFQADILLKVAPPTLDEIQLLKNDQTLFSPLHLPTLDKEYIVKLMSKKITAIAYEYLKDVAGSYPFVRSMSEIAGSSVILIAAEYLSNTKECKGLLLGGIAGVPPSKVVILGAGVVGTYAAQAAIGLGASVTVFDNNIYKLMRLQSHLGFRVFTSVISPAILDKEMKNADVVIGAIHSGQGRTQMIVSEEMVSHMKPGSVIVDVSIDQGGCFETSEITSHDQPTFIKHDVIHYCVPNIASRVSRTATQAISNILCPLLLRGHQLGGIRSLLLEDSGVRHGAYIYKGNLINDYLSKKFDIKLTNLELLFSRNI